MEDNENKLTGKDKIQKASMEEEKGSIDVRVKASDEEIDDVDNDSTEDQESQDELYTKKELEKFKTKSYDEGKRKALRNIARKLGKDDLSEEDIAQWYERANEYEELASQNKTQEQKVVSSLERQNREISTKMESLTQERNLFLEYITEYAIEKAIEIEAEKLGAIKPSDVSQSKKVYGRLKIDVSEFLDSLKDGDYENIPIVDKVSGEPVNLTRIIESFKKDNPHFFNSVRSSGSGYPNRPNYPGTQEKQLFGRDKILHAKN